MGEFTADERKLLGRYFTNLDGPVFALVNLPEVVKGALFARYSRSALGLRELFLKEFVESPQSAVEALASQAVVEGGALGKARAEELYRRIFDEYGDDSVAQLGGAHIACEGVSNLLTKVLERGRLMAYLEQSTRYIPYDKKVAGEYRYVVPPELTGTTDEQMFRHEMDTLFATYQRLYPAVENFVLQSTTYDAESPRSAYKAAVKAKVCDVLRGLLPAACRSNVGVFGSGQAFEALLLRLMSNPLRESRDLGKLVLAELEKVIPSFVSRVPIPDRGGAWIEYFETTRESVSVAVGSVNLEDRDVARAVTSVRLIDYDPEGERKIAAAILFEYGHASMEACQKRADKLSRQEVAELVSAYVGRRQNRRHRPGRAFEATDYVFEVVSDYGAFRDLQRHRILTIEWQPLSTALGYTTPEVISAMGRDEEWGAAMNRAAEYFEELRGRYPLTVAAYAVPMAFRIRYVMKMNAREAMHMIELRTSPQGHPEYRFVCSEMRRLIGAAGHRAIADSMQFAEGEGVALERLAAETRAAERRTSGR